MTSLIVAPTIGASRDLDEPAGVTGYLYRMMTRTMDGVVLFDDVGRIIFANAAFGRLVGVRSERLVQQSFLGLLRESERPMVLLRWRRLGAGQEDNYRVHLDERWGDRLIVVVQHRIDHGGTLHIAYVRDVSESTELSRQIHELTGLTSIARAFASITDPREVTRHLVTELAQLLGVEKCFISRYDPVSDMVEPLAPAVGIADAVLPTLRRRLAECGHLSQITQTGQPRLSNDAARDPLLDQKLVRSLQISSILTVPLTIGRRILGFVSVINRYGAGFHDDDVRPLLIFAGQAAVVLDNARLVSELASEKDLALARAGQLEALINSIVDGVFIVHADGRVITVNAAGRRLTGLPHDDALRPAADYVSLLRLRRLDDQPVAAADLPWNRALAGHTVQHQELLLRGVGQSKDAIISVSSAPVYGPAGTVALSVVVARDVTDVRDLQRHKDEFLSIASHELRTPLTTLRGYAQQVLRMLQRDTLDRDRAVKNLQLVIRQVDRLAGLAGDLVDVSRLETGHLRLASAPCDLVAVASEVVDRCRASASPRHRLAVLADGPVVGAWDAARLEQVLANLIGNAIKYSPDGGAVDVRVSLADNVAAVSVRDEGIGIPTDKLPHLFQAFYRVEGHGDRYQPGLGLGLHIAHELVRLHGGSIAARSHVGKGSEFTVTLPLTPPAP